jgi:hypothetical protein
VELIRFREEGIRDLSEEVAIDLRRLESTDALLLVAFVGETLVTLISGLSGSLEEDEERTASLSVRSEVEEFERECSKEREERRVRVG